MSAPRRGLALLGLALTGSACSAAPEEPAPAATSDQAIVAGSAVSATVDASVVPLLAGGRIYCTGTLVTPFVVVTAAHCLADAPPEAVGIPGPVPTLPVAASIAHPDFDPATLANDLALVVLQRPADPDAVALLVPGTLDDAAGRPLRIVGFGKSSLDDTTPTKRAGTALIAGLEPKRLVVEPRPSGPCNGDSGGPAFLTSGGHPVLAGVVSAGEPTCTGLSYFTRIDSFLPWISDTIARLAPHSQGPGARCFLPSNCQGGACYAPPDAPTHAYCTEPCDDDHACPSPLRCEQGRCLHALPSPGALGSACAEDAACEAARCASASDDAPPVCAALCVEDFTGCDVGTCRRDGRHPGKSACLAPDLPPAAGGCTTSRAPASPGPALLAVLAGLALGRRRLRLR